MRYRWVNFHKLRTHHTALWHQIKQLNIHQHASVRTPFKSCCFSPGSTSSDFPAVFACFYPCYGILSVGSWVCKDLSMLLHVVIACSFHRDCASIYPFYSPWASGEFPAWALTTVLLCTVSSFGINSGTHFVRYTQQGGGIAGPNPFQRSCSNFHSHQQEYGQYKHSCVKWEERIPG